MAAQLQKQTAQTAQQVLAQATQKLEEAIKEVGSRNDFAVLLQELLEVSSKVAQFDEMTFAAKEAAISEEAQTWKEISMMTLQHCRMQLIDRQRSLIEQLQVLSEDGASLAKIPVPLKSTIEAKAVSEVEAPQSAIGPPPGLPSPPSCAYPSPDPSESSCSKKPTAQGLGAPPGLNHASPPSGFVPQNQLHKAQKAKKKSSAKAGNPKQVTVSAVSDPGSSMLNLDAYESD